MLQIAYFLAKIGADTAENERNFADRPSCRRPVAPVDDLAARGYAAGDAVLCAGPAGFLAHVEAQAEAVQSKRREARDEDEAVAARRSGWCGRDRRAPVHDRRESNEITSAAPHSLQQAPYSKHLGSNLQVWRGSRRSTHMKSRHEERPGAWKARDVEESVARRPSRHYRTGTTEPAPARHPQRLYRRTALGPPAH